MNIHDFASLSDVEVRHRALAAAIAGRAALPLANTVVMGTATYERLQRIFVVMVTSRAGLNGATITGFVSPPRFNERDDQLICDMLKVYVSKDLDNEAGVLSFEYWPEPNL